MARHGFKGRDDDHVHHLSHYATHEVMALAMLYMYLAAPARSGALANGAMPMSGATGTAADFVGLPLLFLIVLLSSGVWELDGIERLSPTRARQSSRNCPCLGWKRSARRQARAFELSPSPVERSDA